MSQSILQPDTTALAHAWDPSRWPILCWLKDDGTLVFANDATPLPVTATVDFSAGFAGTTAHDAPAASVKPVLIGAYASAAAPTSVSADGDATAIWTLRNGSLVVNLAVAGTLVAAGAPLPVTVKSTLGAANLATSNATSTGTAATLVAARATRRSVLIHNTEAVGSSKSVWVGPATVTSANGCRINPGEAKAFTWVGLIQIIDDTTNHAVVTVADEYD